MGMTNDERKKHIRIANMLIGFINELQAPILKYQIEKDVAKEALKNYIKMLKQQPCEDVEEYGMNEQMESSSEKPNKSEIPTDWIPIKTRPMTEEEKEHFFEYADRRCDDTYTILDCPLSDDGQEVILSVNGYVSTDIFCRDSADGCYFESYDIDDVDAWMPFPEPYGESED